MLALLLRYASYQRGVLLIFSFFSANLRLDAPLGAQTGGQTIGPTTARHFRIHGDALTTRMNSTHAPRLDTTDDANFYLASHYFNKPSQLYAYAFWGVILLLVVVARVPLPRCPRRLASPLYRWALLKRPVSVWIANPSYSPYFLPSNSNIVLIFSFFILLCCLCFVGPDYIPGRGFTVDVPTVESVILKSLWTSAARAGLIAFCLLPLTVLLGLKSSPAAVFSWRLTMRLYFDKLAVFHRWSARFLYFFTTLHVVLWTTKLSMDDIDGEIALRKAFRKERFVCGWVVCTLLYFLVGSLFLNKPFVGVWYFHHANDVLEYGSPKGALLRVLRAARTPFPSYVDRERPTPP